MKIIYTNHSVKNIIDRWFTWDFELFFNDAIQKGKHIQNSKTKVVLYEDWKIVYQYTWKQSCRIITVMKLNGKFYKILKILQKIDKNVTKNIDKNFVLALWELTYRYRVYNEWFARSKRKCYINSVVSRWELKWSEFVKQLISDYIKKQNV